MNGGNALFVTAILDYDEPFSFFKILFQSFVALVFMSRLEGVDQHIAEATGRIN